MLDLASFPAAGDQRTPTERASRRAPSGSSGSPFNLVLKCVLNGPLRYLANFHVISQAGDFHTSTMVKGARLGTAYIDQKTSA
jgi:hypothetical protein